MLMRMGKYWKKSHRLRDKTREFFIDAANKLELSARGYHRVLKVARTIADMERARDDRINPYCRGITVKAGDF